MTKETGKKRTAMVVTDLDGTLLRGERTVGDEDLSTLLLLGERLIIRVAATGRSLYSARCVLSEDFPIDYLVFSSGAGIMEWGPKLILKKRTLAKEQVVGAVSLLKECSADFMVHNPIPENHRFTYFESGKENPDFARRCELYREFALKRPYSSPLNAEACQIVAVEPPGGGASIYALLAGKLRPLTVLRTTSPIDGVSTWIEIFPPGVSKARASEWITLREGVPRRRVLAVGNDYNDMDLLEWAPARFVVQNAPEELKRKFPTVSSNDRNGFTEAVRQWFERIKK